jgi:hypothetical protein
MDPNTDKLVKLFWKTRGPLPNVTIDQLKDVIFTDPKLAKSYAEFIAKFRLKVNPDLKPYRKFVINDCKHLQSFVKNVLKREDQEECIQLISEDDEMWNKFCDYVKTMTFYHEDLNEILETKTPNQASIAKTLELFMDRLVEALNNPKLVDFDESIKLYVDPNAGNYLPDMTVSDRLCRLHIGGDARKRWFLLINHLRKLGQQELVHDLTEWITKNPVKLTNVYEEDELFFELHEVIYYMLVNADKTKEFLAYMSPNAEYADFYNHQSKDIFTNWLHIGSTQEIEERCNKINKQSVLDALNTKGNYDKLINFLKCFNLLDILWVIENQRNCGGLHGLVLDKNKVCPPGHFRSFLMQQHYKLTDDQWWWVFKFDNPDQSTSINRALRLINRKSKDHDMLNSILNVDCFTDEC